MISAWDVYWIGQLDKISSCVFALGTLGMFALVGVMVETAQIHRNGRLVRLWGWVSFFSGLVLILAVFIPSSKTAAAMYLIPKIANNERLMGLPDKLIDLGEAWLQELGPKKDENK